MRLKFNIKFTLLLLNMRIAFCITNNNMMEIRDGLKRNTTDNRIPLTKELKTYNVYSDYTEKIDPMICGELCDSTVMDAITALRDNDPTKEYVYIVRGKCGWKYDIKSSGPSKFQYGFLHHFMFSKVQAMYSVLLSANKWNITGIFTAGLSAQVLFYDGKVTQSIERVAYPFPGLTTDTSKPIGGSFTMNNTIYFIQGNQYWAYNLQTKQQISNYPKYLTDFGIFISKVGPIQASFETNLKIYFLTDKQYAIYAIYDRNSSNGMFTGELSSFSAIQTGLIKCKKPQLSYYSKEVIDSKVMDIESHQDKPISFWFIISMVILVVLLALGIVLLVTTVVRRKKLVRKEQRIKKRIRNRKTDLVRDEHQNHSEIIQPNV